MSANQRNSTHGPTRTRYDRQHTHLKLCFVNHIEGFNILWDPVVVNLLPPRSYLYFANSFKSDQHPCGDKIGRSLSIHVIFKLYGTWNGYYTNLTLAMMKYL